MKLIIDIPEVDYNYAKQQVADGITNPLKIFITSGTPIPDNATNGDVIKTIFPNTELHKENDYVSLTIQDGVYLEDRDGSWWFTPYQKGE